MDQFRRYSGIFLMHPCQDARALSWGKGSISSGDQKLYFSSINSSYAQGETARSVEALKNETSHT